MKKNDWKYIVDVLLFVDVCSIAVMGFIMAFVIPSGEGSHAEKFFLGLHRHGWGDIHLYLSLFLLMLLALHIFLSWTWVVESTKKYLGVHWKRFLWGLCGASLVVVIVSRCIKA